MMDEKVEPGEKVYTSGGDRIFPKGLEVGQVTNILPDKERDGFQIIRVKPNANLFRLEQVLVVTEIQDKAPAEEQQESNAAMLASRLPGIDKTRVGTAPKLDAQGNPVPTAPVKPLRVLTPDRFSPPEEHGGARSSEPAPSPNPVCKKKSQSAPADKNLAKPTETPATSDTQPKNEH
jgi:rod shape-determining protein MreC